MILPNPHWSPSPRLQLLRKNTSFLHVTWVTNNGRTWARGRGGVEGTLPNRSNALHLTVCRDGQAAEEWRQRAPPPEFQALRRWSCEAVRHPGKGSSCRRDFVQLSSEYGGQKSQCFTSSAWRERISGLSKRAEYPLCAQPQSKHFHKQHFI